MDGVGTKTVAKPLRAAQSGSEPEKISLAPEPEPLHHLSRWSRAVSGPSRAVTTLPPSGSLFHLLASHKMANPARQPRTLVLCFDGTANKYDENVSARTPSLVLGKLIHRFLM